MVSLSLSLPLLLSPSPYLPLSKFYCHHKSVIWTTERVHFFDFLSCALIIDFVVLIVTILSLSPSLSPPLSRFPCVYLEEHWGGALGEHFFSPIFALWMDVFSTDSATLTVTDRLLKKMPIIGVEHMRRIESIRMATLLVIILMVILCMVTSSLLGQNLFSHWWYSIHQVSLCWQAEASSVRVWMPQTVAPQIFLAVFLCSSSGDALHSTDTSRCACVGLFEERNKNSCRDDGDDDDEDDKPDGETRRYPVKCAMSALILSSMWLPHISWIVLYQLRNKNNQKCNWRTCALAS